jgi:hypothetical protein
MRYAISQISNLGTVCTPIWSTSYRSCLLQAQLNQRRIDYGGDFPRLAGD